MIVVAAAVRAHITKERALAYLLGQQDDPNAAVASQATDPNSLVPVTGETPSAEGSSSGGAQSSSNQVEERDIEMEDALTEELQNGDPFADYDIEVVKEGEAINEYLSLLISAENNVEVSSSSQ